MTSTECRVSVRRGDQQVRHAVDQTYEIRVLVENMLDRLDHLAVVAVTLRRRGVPKPE
jgi:hypothetical protein